MWLFQLYQDNYDKKGQNKAYTDFICLFSEEGREGEVVGVRIPRPSFAPRPVVE